MHRAVTVSAVFGLLFAVLLVLLTSGLRESVFALVLGLFQLGVLFMLVWAWRRGDRFAPWLMLAGALVLVAAEWLLACSLGFASTGFLSQYGMLISVAVNLPIVMVVLLQRSRHWRENIRRVQSLDRVDPATGLIHAVMCLQNGWCA